MKSTVPAWPYPSLAAHRGGGSLAPENTLAAHRVGYDHGYRMVEFDAKLSGDGAVILMHDATVDRTTNGSGRVAGSTLAELAKLDAGSWHSPRFAGEPVPTLAAIAAFCLANHVAANVEIKPCPGRERETGAAVALEARRLWRNAAVPPLLSSFSFEALESARAAAPELPRAHLFTAPPPDWIELLRQLDAIALDARHDHLTPELLAAAAAAGFRVVTYTVNDPARAEELLRDGVATVITDRIDLIPAAG